MRRGQKLLPVLSVHVTEVSVLYRGRDSLRLFFLRPSDRQGIYREVGIKGTLSRALLEKFKSANSQKSFTVTETYR